jgi:hypothetical protein
VAINTHTVYTGTTIESRLHNTSNVENFVIRFAHLSFSYDRRDGFEHVDDLMALPHDSMNNEDNNDIEIALLNSAPQDEIEVIS